MTQEQQNELIASATELFRETLGDCIDDINAACAVALEESQDSEKGTCKLRVPFALILNLAHSPPSFHIESAVATRRKFVSESAQLADDTPKLPGIE